MRAIKPQVAAQTIKFWVQMHIAELWGACIVKIIFYDLKKSVLGTFLFNMKQRKAGLFRFLYII